MTHFTDFHKHSPITTYEENTSAQQQASDKTNQTLVFSEWQLMQNEYDSNEGDMSWESYDTEEDSDTETDSETEIIISGDNQRTLHKGSEDLTATDPQNGEIFFVAQGGQSLLFDEKTAVELEVCGGNIYALLMGKEQPYYLVGHDQDKLHYYRVGSKIDFVKDAEGECIFQLGKSVSGFVFSLVISYFLGDDDISNVVAVDRNGRLQVVRLDPEFCFSPYFLDTTYNNQAKILEELNFLYRLNAQDCPNSGKLKELALQETGLDFFSNCFVNHKLFTNAHCLSLLTSSCKNQELLAALKKIIETPFQSYEQIVEKTITSVATCERIKEALKIRLTMFKQAYIEIQKRLITHENNVVFSSQRLFMFHANTSNSQANYESSREYLENQYITR